MGAVGAASPTDFEESSILTLNFHTKVILSSVFEAHLKICTHSFDILNRPLTKPYHRKKLLEHIRDEFIFLSKPCYTLISVLYIDD